MHGAVLESVNSERVAPCMVQCLSLSVSVSSMHGAVLESVKSERVAPYTVQVLE